MTGQTLLFRRCDLADAPELCRLAQSAIATDKFYGAVFGFAAQDFAAYWRAYFHMVLNDPAAEVFALAAGQQLVACAALSYHGFPGTAAGDRFLADLDAALTPEGQSGFARFAAAYEELMTSPYEQSCTEVQGLWMLVAPTHRGMGLVAKMLRAWDCHYRPAAIQVLCGLVNAGAPELVAAYRRIGFRIDRSIEIGSVRISRIALQLSTVRNGAEQPQAAHENTEGFIDVGSAPRVK